MQSPDTADLDLIAHVDHDASYTLVESVPVLCDCCEEPLTLSMASLATMKQSVPGTLQLPGQALVHQHAGMVEVNRNEAMVTAYQKAISHYRTSLADDDFHKVTQNTTFADVVAELIACKNAQQTGTRKAGKAQQHLDALLQRIHHYTGVIDAATQGNMGMVALVWGSIRFLVQVTSSYLSMQVKLTEMLSEIGDNLGRVELFRNLYPSEHMRCTVTVLYAEIVDALRSMISFWQKRRLDQRIFHAFWNPFEVEYQGTLERIRYLVDHVDRTANASHMAVTKTQNEDILLAVQGMQARLDEHQNMFLILYEQTDLARKFSQRLRKYLVSNTSLRVQAELLRFHLARQSYASCSFVVKSPEYQQWSTSRESRVLGLVGGPGSGKTAVSVFIYTQLRTLAADNAPVIFLNCSEISSFTRLQLLRALVWELLEQRPDVLLRNMNRKGYYGKLFREATASFQTLWPLFAEIVRSLHEVWIVLDSIHGCADGRDQLVTDLRRLVDSVPGTNIKLVIGSRHTSDVASSANAVLEYTAADMRQASVDYIAHEAAQLRDDRLRDLLRAVTPDILNAVDRLGGQMVWRRTLVHLVVKCASSSSSSDVSVSVSVDEARNLLSRISDPTSVVERFWTSLCQESQAGDGGGGYNPELLRAITDVLVSTHGPLTLLQIYDTVRASHPHALDGVGVGELGALMKDKFSACTSLGYGFFDMDSLMRKTLKTYLAAVEYPPQKPTLLLEEAKPGPGTGSGTTQTGSETALAKAVPQSRFGALAGSLYSVFTHVVVCLVCLAVWEYYGPMVGR